MSDQIHSHQPDTSALLLDERIKLMHQGLMNMLAPVLSALVGLVLVPIMFKGLGAELYGLWLVVMNLVDSSGVYGDFGVSWSVMREIAASKGGADSAADQLVSAGANFYLLLAIGGAVIIAAAGLPIGHFMATKYDQILPLVFTFAAAGFVSIRMFNFQIIVLQGLRRFDLSNLLSICSKVITATVIIATLALGGGLLAVVRAQAVVATVCAMAGYRLVIHTEPRFRQRWWKFDWTSLRPHIRFSLGNQLTAILSNVTWETAPLLIGFILGPAWVSTYQIGRKFPMALAALLWPFALVMFPAASEHQRAGDRARAGEALEAGTRWLLLLVTPACVELLIMGPNLLQTWLGQVPSGALPIFILMTAVVGADATSFGAVGVLLGRGAVGSVLRITGMQAAANLTLTISLLYLAGVRGAAWALLATTPLAAAAMLYASGLSAGVPFGHLVRRTFSGLWFPAAACAAVTYLVMHRCAHGRWHGIILTVSAASFTYAICFYLHGAREEERVLVEDAAGVLRATAIQGLGALRVLTRRPGRSA
jgi:O-antigen/teichoic acid export membrane protein